MESVVVIQYIIYMDKFEDGKGGIYMESVVVIQYIIYLLYHLQTCPCILCTV
jgi:hypothetical protein